jgi:hypothetical protein
MAKCAESALESIKGGGSGGSETPLSLLYVNLKVEILRTGGWNWDIHAFLGYRAPTGWTLYNDRIERRIGLIWLISMNESRLCMIKSQCA